MTFQIYSAQTGDAFAKVDAATADAALDKFAQRQGYKDAAAMWRAGRFEYASATRVQ